MQKKYLLKDKKMRWGGYGLVLHVKDFSSKYNLIGVLSEHGYWKGLSSKNKCHVSIFTQAMCYWEGKNYDDIGYWDFNKMMHLPYTVEGMSSTDHTSYLSYLTCLYIAYMGDKIFPQRVKCKENFEILLSVKHMLSEYKWLKAWGTFEEYVACIAAGEYDKAFFEQTYTLINEQYQFSIAHPFRIELLKNIY